MRTFFLYCFFISSRRSLSRPYVRSKDFTSFCVKPLYASTFFFRAAKYSLIILFYLNKMSIPQEFLSSTSPFSDTLSYRRLLKWNNGSVTGATRLNFTIPNFDVMLIKPKLEFDMIITNGTDTNMAPCYHAGSIFE